MPASPKGTMRGARETDWTRRPVKMAAAVFLLCVTLGALARSLGHQTIVTSGPPRTALPDGRIDLNSANAAELEALPRIGPALAERIMEHRERFGGFRRIEDLDRVQGIGERTIELLRPFVRIDEEADSGGD